MEEKANSIYEMVGVYQVDLIIQNFHEDHFLNIQTNILLDGGHWSSCDCHISQCVIMKLNPSVVLELWNNVVITQALLMLIFGYQIFPYWNFSIVLSFDIFIYFLYLLTAVILQTIQMTLQSLLVVSGDHQVNFLFLFIWCYYDTAI